MQASEFFPLWYYIVKKNSDAPRGTYKVRNEINENETKRNQRNGNEMKRNQRNRLI